MATDPTFTLPDSVTQTLYRLYVEGTTRGEGPVPAILFMDGDDQFSAAREAYHAAREAGTVPPLLLVGVGYGASYTKPGNFRVRDYTPTALATEHASGGADPFLGWVTTILWPELKRRYAVRDDVRGLAGHSLGSLLVVHALMQRQPFFNRLLASAPALWWDDRTVLCAADRLQRTGAALPARLFLCVGENDTASMTSDLDQFETQLAARPFPKLEVISRRFPERDHYNVLPVAFRAGLEALFR
jgi:predicted alpha/beta superfamily hydrolase